MHEPIDDRRFPCPQEDAVARIFVLFFAAAAGIFASLIDRAGRRRRRPRLLPGRWSLRDCIHQFSHLPRRRRTAPADRSSIDASSKSPRPFASKAANTVLPSRTIRREMHDTVFEENLGKPTGFPLHFFVDHSQSTETIPSTSEPSTLRVANRYSSASVTMKHLAYASEAVKSIDSSTGEHMGPVVFVVFRRRKPPMRRKDTMRTTMPHEHTFFS